MIADVITNYKQTRQHDDDHQDIEDKQTADEHKADVRKDILKSVKAKTLQEAPEKPKLPEVQEDKEEQIVTTKYELKLQEMEGKNSVVENGDVSKSKFGIRLCNVNSLGKSVIHYIITPLDYGSYENQEFLNYLLKFGFRGDIADNDGKKPFEYAKDLSSDTMLNTLKLYNAAPLSSKLNDHAVNFKKLEDWEDINYLKDSQDYLDLAKMDIDKKNLVP